MWQLLCLVFTITLWQKVGQYKYPHFKDKEIETQK